MYCQTPDLGLRVDCAFTQQEHKTKFIMMRLVKEQKTKHKKVEFETKE